MNRNFYPQVFQPGEKVVSLVSHPPEIQSGTEATIISPYQGLLYAVQLPNGELHRWFAGFELAPFPPRVGQSLRPGEYAVVTNTKGHPPMIQTGTKVKIIKAVPTVFYDLWLENGNYHRWLADFEIVPKDILM